MCSFGLGMTCAPYEDFLPLFRGRWRGTLCAALMPQPSPLTELSGFALRMLCRPSLVGFSIVSHFSTSRWLLLRGFLSQGHCAQHVSFWNIHILFLQGCLADSPPAGRVLPRSSRK